MAAQAGLSRTWSQTPKTGFLVTKLIIEPPHDKTNKMACAPSEDSDQPGHLPSLISLRCLGIRPVWSESSLPAWRKLGSLATHLAHSQDTDRTGQMPRLIWVFAGHTCYFVGFVTKPLIYTKHWSSDTWQVMISTARLDADSMKLLTHERMESWTSILQRSR